MDSLRSCVFASTFSVLPLKESGSGFPDLGEKPLEADRVCVRFRFTQAELLGCATRNDLTNLFL